MDDAWSCLYWITPSAASTDGGGCNATFSTFNACVYSGEAAEQAAADWAALRRRAYEVALPVVDGSVGLSIGVFDGVVVVRALNGGKDLAPSAAQACGAIAAGDRLLAVGGVELAPLPMAEARSRRAHSPRALRALSESENAPLSRARASCCQGTRSSTRGRSRPARSRS